MSMTKRYLHSLPETEQDAILGVTPEGAGVDPDYEAARDAYESEQRAIEPGAGADDNPDYGDLDEPVL